MSQHRVDQVSARKQPTPRPLPEPAEVFEVRPAGPAHRRLQRHVSDWRHGLMRRLRSSRRARWALIAAACVAVLIVGLLVQGFLSSPAPSIGPPDAVAAIGADTSASPSPSPAKKSHGAGDNRVVSNPVGYLKSHFPDNPLNHLHAGGLHDVDISASAPGPMMVVGYLVPTGLGEAYGRVAKGRSHWSLHEQAIGPGYLAAIFVQTDKSGTPITCTVSIDGKVTSTETTSGSWGRALCLG